MAGAALSILKSDLFADDVRAQGIDCTRLRVRRIESASDPLFEAVYALLWKEFGDKGELEDRAVLGRRLERNSAPPTAQYALRYEMLVVERDGEIVGLHDHTAIIDLAAPAPSDVIVHLSHTLVLPAYRGSGFAGILWALPMQLARSLWRDVGRVGNPAISLCAEMEIPNGVDESRIVRLKAVGRSGYRRVDASAIGYLQPDFRAPSEIDASGGPQPLPLWLLLRRCAREAEDRVPAADIVHLISCLYAMYGEDFRAQDMAPLWAELKKIADRSADVRLLPPLDGVEVCARS